MIRILFVDDEPHVLDGIRRLLRPKRHEWEMAFAAGGEEALSIMGEHSFDAVVTDMQMPGMDGVALLMAVRERHPDTVRIVLSGQARRDAIMKVVSPAHQFLSKPCEPDQLEATLGRALALRQLLANERLTELVSGVDSLPSIPTLYAALVEELNGSDPSLARVARIVEQDVGMSAQILKLVNLAFFGLKREVESISASVTYLGVDTISSLVLAHGVFDQFKSPHLDSVLMDGLWAHSMATSRGAVAISGMEGFDDRITGSATTAGVLHDLGRLLLASWFPDGAREMLDRQETWEGTEDALEMEVFDATHAQVGAYLLGLWGLPDPLVEAVAFHTRPSASVGRGVDALTAVHCADVLVREGVTAEAPGLDWAYIDAIGARDRVPEWHAACQAKAARRAGQ